MPQNPLLIRSVAVLVGLVVFAARPGQAATDDTTRNASFGERWQAVPRNDDFTCNFTMETENTALQDNEDKPPVIRLPRDVGRYRRVLDKRMKD